jgi:hypothetical protein
METYIICKQQIRGNCLRSSRMIDSFKIIITQYGFANGVVDRNMPERQ